MDDEVHEQATQHFGDVQLHGLKDKETMCLKQLQHRSERTPEAGRLCVMNQTFLAAEYIKGDFRANGVLGLAPS